MGCYPEHWEDFRWPHWACVLCSCLYILPKLNNSQKKAWLKCEKPVEMCTAFSLLHEPDSQQKTKRERIRLEKELQANSGSPPCLVRGLSSWGGGRRFGFYYAHIPTSVAWLMGNRWYIPQPWPACGSTSLNGDATQRDRTIPHLKTKDHDLPHLEGKDRYLSSCVEKRGEGRERDAAGQRREKGRKGVAGKESLEISKINTKPRIHPSASCIILFLEM